MTLIALFQHIGGRRNDAAIFGGQLEILIYRLGLRAFNRDKPTEAVK
ncbi:MAG: hypothetical protein JRF56_00760 [Deltaproteobacteria bacterium]|jgi:hypothetical protein|nr:hypothetical protein [Deltaproteobacteria bacterium]